MGTTITLFVLSLVIFGVGLATVMAARAIRAYLRTRGKRLVTCPENNCSAAVELDAKGAGLNAFQGGEYLCLKDCSRWPEMRQCGQECMSQVETLGAGCLVRNVVARWYTGKLCAYCRKPVDDVTEWTGHTPALLTPEGRTVGWDEVSAEKLPEVFTTHQPVCWSCHIAEAFRRQHPELITDRPARW